MLDPRALTIGFWKNHASCKASKPADAAKTAGLPAARQFLRHTLLDSALGGEVGGLDRSDHKSALQEWLQQRGLGAVQYRVRNEFGPEHQKTFEVEVWLAQQKLAHSEGRSKKEAEQAAAKIALAGLESGPTSS